MAEGTDTKLVARRMKETAWSHYIKGNFADACFYYLNYLKTEPECKNEVKHMVIQALNYRGQQLEEMGDYREIFIIYEEALKIYSDSEEIHHNLGAHLLNLDCPEQADSFFKEALRHNANYFPAYRSLHSSYCFRVERWHYRMLNDSLRNESYRQAIIKKIHAGFDTVLDIGTGTGLFCLYALEGGAKTIYGCDYNRTMISIASKILEENSISDRIKLLFSHSNDIYDIPERVSLVVTETMDACMLGEHMLQSLEHAWLHLLKPRPSAMVIPHSGSVWFSLIQCKQLARQYMFPLTHVDMDDCSNAFANITLTNSRPQNFKHLNLERIEFFFDLEGPYDAERLQFLSHCTFLTEPQRLFNINFNDPDDISAFLHNEDQCCYDVPCTSNGYFHAIAAWFQVQLDENISLCSAPNDANAKNCCWEQAIFPSQRAYRVVPGCTINVLGGWKSSKVNLQMQQITYPDGAILNGQPSPTAVSSYLVSMLNDSNLVEHLKEAALSFTGNLRGKDDLRILDFFPMPIFGLSILLNLHLIGTEEFDGAALLCIVQSWEDAEIIKKVALQNGIPLGYLAFHLEKDFHNFELSDFAPFDVIMVNMLGSDGDLDENILDCVNGLKAILKPDGILLPSKVEICGQLVYSEYMEKCMRVTNNDINRFGIGRAINEYQVSQMVQINLHSVDLERYSDIFTCCQFAREDFLSLHSTFSKEFFVKFNRPGHVNAIPYWYNVYFVDDTRSYSSLGEFSYVQQAAFLTESSIHFQQNDTAVVQFVYHSGGFKIDLKNCDNCSF